MGPQVVGTTSNNWTDQISGWKLALPPELGQVLVEEIESVFEPRPVVVAPADVERKLAALEVRNALQVISDGRGRTLRSTLTRDYIF